MALPDNLPLPRGAPLDEQDREGWRITDERSAEWVMRKLAAFRERMAEQETLRREYRQQLDDWWDDATRTLLSDIAWAEGVLKSWAISQRDADPEAKTLNLPSGRVSTRWVPPHPQTDDASALAASLARAGHPNYDLVVKATVSIDVRELAKLIGIADEWMVTLSCDCTVSHWQFGDLDLVVGQPWPWHDDEHDDDRRGALGVARFQRGRVGKVVVAGEDGRIVALDGVTMLPGRISAAVMPR